MLLQLPLELQQRIAGNLSVHQALNLREVSHQCRRLASASIRSVTLSSAADVGRVSDSFPGLTHLSLTPETHEDMVLLSSAFHPEQGFAFPPTLTDLEIDTSCAGFDSIRWFELGKLAACSVLDSIQISACYVDLTADDNVLQKLTGLLTAEAGLEPTYPPMCFLSSGIVNADNLSRCTNLQRLKTYTRSNEDTDDLMASLAGHRSLQVLELHVPCVGSVVAAATDLSRVTDLKLIGNLAADEFPFDLSAFPNVEFLVVSLHYISPEPVGPRIVMRHLTTVWLNNVTNIYALQHAPVLSTLSLNYSQSVFTSMEPHLRGVLSTIPELRRLEIRNVDVDAGSIVACPRLQEVVLADVIAVMEHAPVLYLADLVSSRTLRKIWISSEANGYLVPTEQFEFARKPPGVSPSGVCFRQLGWRGRICRPDGPQEWFGELGSSGVDHWRLGLQLTRGRAL